MKILGILRKLDNAGRIMLPKEILKHGNFKKGDTIEVFLTDEKDIILKKYKGE